MRLRLAALAPLAAALGCAGGFAGWLPCPESFADAMRARGVDTSCSVLRRPGRLVEQSKAAFEKGDLETSYHYLALIHTLHPDSAESREAFPLAARIFARLHFRYRSAPDRWDTTEPRFLFGWLEDFFEDDAAFPQQPVEALFLGTRVPLFRDFLAYAEGRPHLSRWALEAKKDNGIVTEISAVPVSMSYPE